MNLDEDFSWAEQINDKIGNSIENKSLSGESNISNVDKDEKYVVKENINIKEKIITLSLRRLSSSFTFNNSLSL